jgi:hypothetical protein
MCQHRSHWTDFFEISYWGFLKKPVDDRKFWLKSGKNIGGGGRYMRPKYVLLLQATLNRHKSAVFE